MIDQDRAASGGSRTAAYVVAGALATIPVAFMLTLFVGLYGAVGAVTVLWTCGTLWLLRKRQDDPAWDHRPTAGRR